MNGISKGSLGAAGSGELIANSEGSWITGFSIKWRRTSNLLAELLS